MAFPVLILFLVFSRLEVFTSAQNISTNIFVPPLQWLHLSPHLQGSYAPPALKDAAIGYDEGSRSLIIFGGESQSGFVQSQTYLLNLDSLTWSRPSPPPNLQRTPAARSAAVAGVDFAASNRHGFIVIGGKGSDGRGLSDVWEFDFINQFWSQLTLTGRGPSGRWGAVGGIDIRVAPVQDPVVPGPNNTFYLVGGYDGTSVLPSSDVWRLSVSGTVSSNLPDDSYGSWDDLSIQTLPSRLYQAGTVVSDKFVIAGGCSSLTTNISCAQQDTHVIDIQQQSSISPAPCPAPRYGPVIVPNLNLFSSAYSSQAFLLLGTFDQSLWKDDGALAQGEVAVLDTDTGIWSRILPAGDPGVLGQVSFPKPRRGAAATSFQTSLVGNSRSSSSDTIIFGGEDDNGTYLSDLWVLRAYDGIATSSNSGWSGFGDGQLQTGVNANGAGVSNQFLSACAQQLSGSLSPPTNHTSPPAPSPSPSPSPPLPGSGQADPFSTEIDTSTLHKLLSTLSIAFLQPAALIFRLSPDAFPRATSHSTWLYLAGFIGLSAYGTGIAGLAMSFQSLRKTTNETTPVSLDVSHLTTHHAKTGLALFICLYCLIPILLVYEIYVNISRRRAPNDGLISENHMSHPMDGQEKQSQTRVPRSAPQSLRTSSPPASPRPRTHSWGPSSMWQRSLEGGLSTDTTESLNSNGPPRAFEVINRPARQRQASGSWRAVPLLQASAQHNLASRSLGEIDWLRRRRSLNVVGELDYAISQAHRAELTVPETESSYPNIFSPPPRLPSLASESFQKTNKYIIFLRVIVHWVLLGLSVVCLLMLWRRAPRALFAIFLAWTAAFSLLYVVFSWNNYISDTSLFFLFPAFRSASCGSPPGFNSTSSRLDRIDEGGIPTPAPSPGPGQGMDPNYTFPVAVASISTTAAPGPYLHQAPHRLATLDDYSVQGDPISDGDNDEDEDTRQMRIEEEIGRREVSIITIPKRKLWITNPS